MKTSAAELFKLLKTTRPKLPMLLGVWAGSAVLSIFLIFALILLQFNTRAEVNEFSLYSSNKPLVLGTMTAAAVAGDPRVAKVNQVFKSYNCPLAGLGWKFVEEADKNGIPYWVVAAIAFQESSCGKKTPESDGVESFNAWGWAVYGDNVKMFDSWEHGIEVVSKYMSERFFSQGVTDLCEIMATYTPPSQGSWCKGVDFFGDEIHTYISPEKAAI